MKKYVILFVVLFLGRFAYSQQFSYEFVIEGVTESVDAKYTIIEIRDLLGVRAIRFDDDLDKFTILSHLEWDVEEMIYDFGTIGFVLVGDLIKTNLE